MSRLEDGLCKPLGTMQPAVYQSLKKVAFSITRMSEHKNVASILPEDFKYNFDIIQASSLQNVGKIIMFWFLVCIINTK